MSKELIARLRHESPGPNHIATEAADTIEQQQSWIESLEQNARDADRMYKELETELAAAQAQLVKMREAIERYLPESDHYSDNGVQFYKELSEVLDQPADTTALRELLKAERERCAKIADEWQTAIHDPRYQCDCAAAIRAMEDQ